MDTSALLSENSFPKDRPSWEDLVPSAQTWTAWNLTFVPLHSAMERDLWASSQRGESFSSANLVMAALGITAAVTTHPTTGQGPASMDYMAQFDGQINNLSAAATNSCAALGHFSDTTTTQYVEIKALLTALKTASSPISYAVADATESTPLITTTEAKRRISQLEAGIPNNWHRGAFCSTHGWGVNKNHTSEN